MDVALMRFFQEKACKDDFAQDLRRVFFDDAWVLRQEIPYAEFYRLKRRVCKEANVDYASFSQPTLISEDPDSKYANVSGVYANICNITLFYKFEEKSDNQEDMLVFVRMERKRQA